jgi:hypothetical protein
VHHDIFKKKVLELMAKNPSLTKGEAEKLAIRVLNEANPNLKKPQ